MNKFKHVEIEIADRVCTITLSRPKNLNAMNGALIDEVARAFDLANMDATVNVIIFTGAGRAFCAGDDRNEHIHPQNERDAVHLVHAIQRVTRAIIFGDKLVVGAINGWAVGGGFEWAINCDFAIWAKSAKGFFPEVSLNLFVTGGVTSLLPAMVGLNKAREMLLLGDKYSADELHRLGIAWRVVDDTHLMSEAHQLANRLASFPSKSSRAMKRVLNQTAVTDLTNALKLETDATVAGFMDPKTTRLLKDF
ncbi:MAG: enoyl-CoA hydratase/isomerase family protein [Gammaproteobacteria bacterium]|nr:enoyl-CoA hydratase/isomerase family protein [Gammaproteobacteria bacterium]